VPGKPELLRSGEDQSSPANRVSKAAAAGCLSTTADYHRFCAMLTGAARRWVRLIAQDAALMAPTTCAGRRRLTQVSTSLFSEANNAGTGFGLGFGVLLDPAKALVPGRPANSSGAASSRPPSSSIPWKAAHGLHDAVCPPPPIRSGGSSRP
jgi:hypothetical protein